jgi:thioredoxin-related protein
MRHVVRLFSFLLLLTTFAALGRAFKPEPARDIVNTAVKQAAMSGKSVFLIFHASWCGWCKRLDSAFADSRIKQLIEANYVVVRLDVMESAAKKDSLENPGGDTLMKEFGGEKSGLPFIVFLDATGKKIADSNVMPGNQNIGYPSTKAEIAAFEKLLKKTAGHMTEHERAEVKAYLEKHASP